MRATYERQYEVAIIISQDWDFGPAVCLQEPPGQVHEGPVASPGREGRVRWIPRTYGSRPRQRHPRPSSRSNPSPAPDDHLVAPGCLCYHVPVRSACSARAWYPAILKWFDTMRESRMRIDSVRWMVSFWHPDGGSKTEPNFPQVGEGEVPTPLGQGPHRRGGQVEHRHSGQGHSQHRPRLPGVARAPGPHSPAIRHSPGGGYSGKVCYPKGLVRKALAENLERAVVHTGGRRPAPSSSGRSVSRCGSGRIRRSR